MAAPSFSSFPPSFSSFPDLESSEPRSQSPAAVGRPARERESERSRSRKDKDKERRKRKGDRHARVGDVISAREERVEFDDERVKAQEDLQRRTTSTVEHHALEQPNFYSDRKGDPLNVRYGGPDAKDVPRYHLVGYGRKILGLNNAWTALSRSSRGVEIGVGRKRKQPAITDSSSRALLGAPPTRRLIPSAESALKFPEIGGFIRLPSRRQQRQGNEDYRSIERPKDNADSDFDSDSSGSAASESSDDDHTTTLTAHQERMRDLEHEISANPSSVNTWLALLSHSLSQIPVTTKNAPKARSEITLSILSRALSSLPKNVPSVRLRLIYLQAGEEVWEPGRLAEEWDKALLTGDLEIRLAWLDWRIRNADRGVDGMLDDAVTVFSILTNELERLRILWRLAAALRQTGFVERSMAMFQAQAELAFNLPDDVADKPLDDKLDALEEFWESEALRVGEPRATGWARWVAAGKPGPGSIPSTSSPSSTVHEDPYVRWARDEWNADQVLQPPLRSADPRAELDPYTTILFSDIRPFLTALTSPRSKIVFRLIWLSFLGLHIPGFESSVSSSAPSENTDDRWTHTHLTSLPYVSVIFPSPSNTRRVALDSQAGTVIGKEMEYSASFGPVKHWSYRAVAPLEASELRNGEARWGMWTAEDVRGVNIDFIRHVFEHCRTDGEDVEWDVMALAFEAAVSIKGALKLSRSYLASARESLPHWAAHARLERVRGRLDDARKVYETVLTAPTSSQSRLSTGPLWWDWAEMEWLARRPDAAIQVALRAAGVQGPGGVAILRAKRTLEDTAREIPAALWKAREAWLKLGALLELLTGAGLPALVTDPVEAGTVAQESMAVASLSMLFHHIVTLRSAAQPAVLRERLEQAVELYPNNTAILGMFLEMQKGQGVWGRVRGLLSEQVDPDAGKEKGVSRRVYDVWVAGWEKGRWEWEIERTRSGLNAAVDNERTRASPVLWRIFIEFEIRVGQLQRAKSVLFRAIGQCPLVKELYLLAFDRLRAVFSARELNSLGETMAERGLRMRSGLDEVLEGWGENNEGGGASSEGEDEIEHNARELRRLKPY
ncbi:DUF1740-domain-containing protein [Auriscalpium vulgare]|uniref:DUF1740-domain-containing protein n=1 Tax=Auriscalpium vulgare TaxID=40419 RepID=A0ACB8S2V5_9AGAM|nr:DUF1740-domain-containing protein [Auriscalpium vulgare]